MEQHAGTGDRDQSAAGIRALYFPQDGSLPLVPHGRLPAASRKGAPAGEMKARKRMHNLLKPDRRASAAEVEVLRDAGIPLRRRKDGGFCIDPGVERVSDEAAAVARVDSAVAIAELYGLTEGSTALVPRGVLPAQRRKGAPAGEVKARRRMHNLLKPVGYRASAAEVEVLRQAGIPLLEREDGTFSIDRGVERVNNEAAAVAGFDNASAIATLYGLAEGSTALVPRGVLPTQRRKGAPEGEAKARQRMHNLLKPDRRASAAEKEVLRQAGIPLLQQKDGGFCIDPGVERESDEAAAVARVDSAVAIAELYGLTEGSTALVPRGVLPTWSRKGAPEGEARARRRMHDLLKPGRRASAAEERVLREAGIPLLPREDGGFYIAPGVERESGVKMRVGSSAVPALLSGQWRPVAASASSLPVAAVPAWPEQLAAGAVGAVGDPFLAGGREGSHGSGPGLWQAGSGLLPGIGMPWTQDGVPLGQGDGVDPAQPGFPEGQPGFAEVLSGGSGGGLGPVVYAGVDGLGPGGFGGGSVDTLSGVSGVSGVSGFWSAPVNPAAPYTGGYAPGAAWDVHPPGTDTLTQTLATQEPATQELAAWGLGVAAPVYPWAGGGVGSLPGDPVTASGRAGYVPVVADGDTDGSVSGRPAMPAAGAYLPQGLPVTLGARARRDNEQPVQGMKADRTKRPRRG
ncbi:hypothetical protein ACJ6WF_06295 [Streptomyces sp. MMS24-I2-30]|uniref:hypothetical protein n=1 Tax=Streptomyces sp. MMS24-I2-30 TaxID=3351564 RepID=UPI0038968485